MMNKLLSKYRSPTKILGGALLLNILVLGWLAWDGYKSFRSSSVVVDLTLQIERLRGEIIHLDEVLTMSASMAAATGDLHWEKRYRNFEPKLDSAIKEAIRLSPQSKESAASTDAANISLVQQENSAFDLVRQGRREEAQKIFLSEKYGTQKAKYAQGMKELDEQLRGFVAASLSAERNGALLHINLIIVIFFIMLFVWLFVLKMVNQWQGMLSEKNQQLSKQASKLTDLNLSLDRKIQERTRALMVSNEILRNNENELRKKSQAVEYSPSVVLITDGQGNIEYVNRKFTEIAGYSIEEVKGKNPRILKSGHSPPEELKRLWDQITSGKEWRGELYNRKKDGGYYWAYVSISPIKDDHGAITNFVSLQEDVTERKRVEAELIATNKNLIKNESALRNMLIDLKRAHEELKNAQNQLLQTEKLAAIGQLAAGIAHEINNPTGFISSNLETLNKYVQNYSKIIDLAAKLQEAVGKRDMNSAALISEELNGLREKMNLAFIEGDIGNLLTESKSGIERIKKILMDLRTYARADKQDLSVVNLNDVIDSVINIVGNEIKYKAELKKNFGELPPVRCNVQRVGQVFINMLINASQAIKDKGTIEVRTFSKDKRVYTQIVDNGVGIPRENINKIFHPFFTTKGVGKGTGLGLSISYEIIRKLGGEIQVVSEVGKGTTFTVILPEYID